MDIFTPISDYTFIESIKNIWAEFYEIAKLSGSSHEDFYTNNTLMGIIYVFTHLQISLYILMVILEFVAMIGSMVHLMLMYEILA